jgi:hypothetical protein
MSSKGAFTTMSLVQRETRLVKWKLTIVNFMQLRHSSREWFVSVIVVTCGLTRLKYLIWAMFWRMWCAMFRSIDVWCFGVKHWNLTWKTLKISPNCKVHHFCMASLFIHTWQVHDFEFIECEIKQIALNLKPCQLPLVYALLNCNNELWFMIIHKLFLAFQLTSLYFRSLFSIRNEVFTNKLEDISKGLKTFSIFRSNKLV